MTPQAETARGLQNFGETFAGDWGENALLALETIAFKETRGIPYRNMNVMDHGLLEEIGGYAPGDYKREAEKVYRDFDLGIGVCAVDQWIPWNPFSMTDQGFDSGAGGGATTGAEEIIVDGMVIDSPEVVVEHLERFVFPRQEKNLAEFDPIDEARSAGLVRKEIEVQEFLGPNMLKIPYGWEYASFPGFHYSLYGYENYFMAYGLYPEVMEKSFSLQADLAAKMNAFAARTIIEGCLPKLVRLDHDMADSRGTLVAPGTLEDIWFPHFARSIEPLLDAGIRLLWHCDGNLMAMVPRLIEAGIGGFQGFQYEDGMDYEKICSMTDREGGPLMIWAGVSVTTTLPHGTKDDVARELRWLVEHGPRVGLFLGSSSSVTPGTNRENVKALIEGLKHYRRVGRGGRKGRA